MNPPTDVLVLSHSEVAAFWPAGVNSVWTQAPASSSTCLAPGRMKR